MKLGESFCNAENDFCEIPIETNKDQKDDEYIYLLVVEKKERLVEGLRAIKEMIYDLMAIRMAELYKYMKSHKMKMIGIKTDAIPTQKEQ